MPDAGATQDKVRENRLRRWAERLGLTLHKSRARRYHVNDQGGYCISDPLGNSIAGEGFDLDLDGVERFLTEHEAKLRTERGPRF